MQLLPFTFAKKYQLLLSHREESGDPVLWSHQQPELAAVLEVQRVTGQLPPLEMVSEEQFQQQLERTYGGQGSREFQQFVSDEIDLAALAEAVPDDEDLLDADQNAPIVKLINGLFSEALKLKASDIHIETYEKSFSVRYRIDGVLQEILSPDKRLAPLLISRIKVMAKLDIAEKRVPQDGRITIRLAGRPVDIRVSTLPTGHGERVVMRLLDKRNARLDLKHLGMPDATLQVFTELLQNPNGIILVTGPTGSGKTTTLYSGLILLNDRCRNILTVEDPIEYALEGVGQTQVNTKTGMTFAKGLRAMLRQDPDVVLVGEIRDLETAEIAVQASLTGHLVLSTLHTNDAAGAITRLTDIGVEPFLISSALKGVLAQRLVRRLCEHCKTPAQSTPQLWQQLGMEPPEQATEIYTALGCEKCGHSGYQGRIGVYELLPVDSELARQIHDQAPEAELRKSLEQSSQTLLAQGAELVLQGVTDLPELIRCIRGS